ncbi:hypothetical protein ACQP04_03030 [Pseudonocardia halophobica]|uniref:hypothetical protein n=1 Tax=Pseudonocardia halophobica TaxID=29401 RepID=UPI003D8C1742
MAGDPDKIVGMAVRTAARALIEQVPDIYCQRKLSSGDHTLEADHLPQGQIDYAALQRRLNGFLLVVKRSSCPAVGSPANATAIL